MNIFNFKGFVCSLLFILIPCLSIGQSYNLNKSWEELGPYKKPDTKYESSAAGIGPVEFIRVNKHVEGYLLAGSLSGGLFYSTDGGENWKNSGSDKWNYSGCVWADFHPVNGDTWFAVSHHDPHGSSPGYSKDHGGLFRTFDKGATWNRVFSNRTGEYDPYLKIYSTRFHPTDPDKLYILTSSGVFYTKNCNARNIYWEKLPNVQGNVFDMDFIFGYMYISNEFKGKWYLTKIDQENYLDQTSLKHIDELEWTISKMTMTLRGDNLLLLFSYKERSGEIHEYVIKEDSLKLFVRGQRNTFGDGNNFNVPRHNPNYIYVGNGIYMKKYNFETKRMMTLSRDHHVDIEYIEFDPFDTSKVYLCTHGGVYISEDQGESWESKSKGIGIAEICGMSVSAMDPEHIAIGTYHDGSSLRADFNKDGNYFWRTVNGGDGLKNLIHPENPAILYTSNQYTSGGLHFSVDSGRTKINLHRLYKVQNSGWELDAALDPQNNDIVYFNFKETNDFNKGNINICRSLSPHNAESVDVLSDFKSSHKLESYKVYRIFFSEYYPDELIAYVLHFTKDEAGNALTKHRLFKCPNVNVSKEEILNSWIEIEHPENNWVADVDRHPKKDNVNFIAYGAGYNGEVVGWNDKRMIYLLKYKGDKLKSSKDITKNIPNSNTGGYNLIVSDKNGGQIFFATRRGVYFAEKKMLSGKRSWTKLGDNLPHCKVGGLIYNKEHEVLTVGYFGRGIWQYKLY